MQCKNCKFANWDRTATGRLSSTGRGRCSWTKTVQVPPYSQDGWSEDTHITLAHTKALWRHTDRPSCPVGIPKD